MLVRELEAFLLSRFPAQDAESWDRTGMLVGDPEAVVGKVAVALDPTLSSLEFAKAHGCNVLLTHHPLFLDPPESVKPAAREADAVGARIWMAVREGISVLSFHTALDASYLAAQVLAKPLGLTPDGGLLETVGDSTEKGYGRLCDGERITLGELAQRCRDAFERPLRVWGDESTELERVCLWTGGAGTSPRECNALGVDALVCGEVKYHEALDASDLGLCIIELGHDVSEQVHCSILVESALEAGIAHDDIHLRELPFNWR